MTMTVLHSSCLGLFFAASALVAGMPSAGKKGRRCILDSRRHTQGQWQTLPCYVVGINVSTQAEMHQVCRNADRTCEHPQAASRRRKLGVPHKIVWRFATNRYILLPKPPLSLGPLSCAVCSFCFRLQTSDSETNVIVSNVQSQRSTLPVVDII